MATYVSVLFATKTGKGMSHACETASNVYNSFAGNGTLHQVKSRKQCTSTDLAALAKNLGTCGRTASGVTFAIGLDRVHAVSYLNQTQTGFYRTKWPTVREAVEHVLQDYNSILLSSLSFDAAVRSKSEAVSASFGSRYADIVETSVRQTFGDLELTVCIPCDSTLPRVFRGCLRAI